MATNQGTTLAFIVSLIGGLIIFIFSILNVVWFSSGASNFGGYGSFMRGMMDGNHNFMGSYASSTSFFAGLSLVAVICSVIVIIGAVMLRVQPHQHLPLGYTDHSVLGPQLCRHGRVLHRRNPGHPGRSVRVKHQTNNLITVRQNKHQQNSARSVMLSHHFF